MDEWTWIAQSFILKNYSHKFLFVSFYLCFLHHAGSVGLLKIQDTFLLNERLVDFQRSHCELLRGEFYRMKSKICGLQKELSETKEVKSQSIRKWSGNESSAAWGTVHLTFKEIFELLFPLILQRRRRVIRTNIL